MQTSDSDVQPGRVSLSTQGVGDKDDIIRSNGSPNLSGRKVAGRLQNYCSKRDASMDAPNQKEKEGDRHRKVIRQRKRRRKELPETVDPPARPEADATKEEMLREVGKCGAWDVPVVSGWHKRESSGEPEIASRHSQLASMPIRMKSAGHKRHRRRPGDNRGGSQKRAQCNLRSRSASRGRLASRLTGKTPGRARKEQGAKAFARIRNQETSTIKGRECGQGEETARKNEQGARSLDRAGATTS